MFSPTVLYCFIALLVGESAILIFVRSPRLPHAYALMLAALNLVLVAVLVVYLKQRKKP